MRKRVIHESTSSLSAKILNLFLHDIFGERDSAGVSLGLPAGAVHLQEKKLIVAATVCDPPMFSDAMRSASGSTGADVLVIHHGFYPETLNNVFISALVDIADEFHFFEKMTLYFHHSDGYWLVPHGRGPFIALTRGGLRVRSEPPFLTGYERADGVCAAAKIIVKRTRTMGAW